MVRVAEGCAYPHIEAHPGIRGGRPCITGTRLTVMDIVALHRDGMKPNEMTEHYSSRPLRLGEIHAVLAYYYDHQEEIDGEMTRDLELLEDGDRAGNNRRGQEALYS